MHSETLGKRLHTQWDTEETLHFAHSVGHWTWGWILGQHLQTQWNTEITPRTQTGTLRQCLHSLDTEVIPPPKKWGDELIFPHGMSH